MDVRFQYRGEAGKEVAVPTLEDLRVLVNEGTVGEQTLLYDAMTRAWAPAASHAAFRFVRDEAGGQRAAGPAAPASRRPSAADDMGLGLTLSLEEAPDGLDADQAVRELLKERARDDDRPARTDSIALSWNSSAQPAASLTEPKHAAATAAAKPPQPAAEPLPQAAARESAPAEPSGLVFRTPIPKIPERPQPAERPVFRTVAPPPAKDPYTIEKAAAAVYDALRVDRATAWLDELGRHLLRSVGPRALPGTLVLGGLVGLFFVLLSTVREDRPVQAREAPRAASMAVAPDVGGLVNRFASAEESGFQSMVAGVDSLRHVHRIEQVPPIWLEGAYLADAPRYPQVKDFWTRYQAFLRDVEENDTELFRAGFVKSLQAQGIAGAVLSLRVSQAMREFERRQPQREEVYRHMEDLSDASLELHELLVDRADDITYEPALQKDRVSRAPVVEAVAEDGALRDEMWTLLERVFASLDWVGGDVGASRDNLTDRLLEGIEASAR